MFRTIQDFLGAWAYETEATLKMFGALTDESLSTRVHPEVRTLGRLAWHLTQTIPEMGGRTGLHLKGPGQEDPVPTSAAEIAKRYEEAARSVAEAVVSQWTDDDMMVEDDMYGEMWKRGQSLAALASHQTHHRGQMTVLMRMVDLPVPGVYGPSKEEWAQYGMPPQE